VAPRRPPNLLDNDDPLQFWSRLREADERLLGLDYDGTLAPFQVERMDAVPAPGAREALAALVGTGHTHLAIVSGRGVGDVRQLLGSLGVLMVGSHGYERLDPDGRLEQIPLDPSQQEALEQAERAARELGLGDRLERKAAAVAFHTRGVETQEARSMEARISRLWTEAADVHAGLSCHSFDGGVELRACSVDKGVALGELLDRHPGAMAVYVGDDRTDEDAFRMAHLRGGFGVKVGHREIERTAATAWLPDCFAVVEFLRRWTTTTT